MKLAMLQRPYRVSSEQQAVVVADERKASPQASVAIKWVARRPMLSWDKGNFHPVIRSHNPIFVSFQLVCDLHVDLSRNRVTAQVDSIPPLQDRKSTRLNSSH